MQIFSLRSNRSPHGQQMAPVAEHSSLRGKQIPLHEIRRIKGAFDMMIAIAGGDTSREIQRSIFNDADIVVIWKSVYQQTSETTALVDGFLKEIR